jgi:uncharacterized protein
MIALLLMALVQTDKVVVVTATSAFRHSSIEIAEEVIRGMAAAGGFDITYARTEDEMRAALSAKALRRTKLVIFANTTGDLAPEVRAALLRWVRDGGSFVGVHSASDTWHESPEYIEMLGGEFETHPDEMNGTLVVVDREHPATAPLESPHVVFEEFYQFKNFARDRINLLVTRDDGSPLAWSKSFGAGRVFYTALGHREDVWTSAWFQQHLSGAIAWALHREPELPRRRSVR